uniref:Uncharacterized protein n=1 Tax=Proboscia inermis TaxID=420281 RepID=A0A7S0GEE2_9STRA
MKPHKGSAASAPPKLDAVLVKEWCEFYSAELLPQTRMLVKRCTPQLDAYGLFLPGRMGSSVSKDLLQKGLSYGDDDVVAEEEEQEKEKEAVVEDKEEKPPAASASSEKAEEEEEEIEADEEDEYEEYDFEDGDEYYDEEE